MRIFICGSAWRREEMLSGWEGEKDELIFAEREEEVHDKEPFDAVFLLEEWNKTPMELSRNVPVFINAVPYTLSEMNAPENVIRFNGWKSFLHGSNWEATGKMDETARRAAAQVGKRLTWVKDVPGFISATVVSMIINEAFYALKEGISTKEEINTAMKAATHYPYGPFEWGEKIGWRNVHDLLIRLSKSDERYLPSFNPENF